MKASLFILTALAAIVSAAPAPAADAVEQPNLDKRQTFGCGICHDGKANCWSCNPGGCTYNTQKC